MTALAILRRFWWAPVILALVVGLLWYRGSLHEALREREAEQRAHEITVSNYRTAALEREKSDLLNISRVKGETDANDKATVEDYSARITELRNDFAERVRAKAATSASGADAARVPELPDGSGRVNESACQTELLETQLAASELAEKVVGLQAWIKKTAAIEVNGN